MKKGRPSVQEAEEIKKKLFKQYRDGLSTSAAARKTGVNEKTAAKYYKKWIEKSDYSKEDFIELTKEYIPQVLEILDKELEKVQSREEETEYAKSSAIKNNDFSNFDRLTKLLIKLSDQKRRIISDKMNLISKPTADQMIKMGGAYAE